MSTTRPSSSGRMMTDSSASRLPTALTSACTSPTVTCTALTGRPGGGPPAPLAAGPEDRGLGGTPAAGSSFLPQAAVEAAMTSAASSATVRITDVFNAGYLG